MQNKRMQWNELSKVFVILAGFTLGMFLTLGIGGYFHSKASTAPISSMTGMTSSVEGEFFMDMMAMELPQSQQNENSFTFSTKNVMNFMLRFLTGINPGDPKSLLALEVPGLANEQAFLLKAGEGTDKQVDPKDYTPSEDVLQPIKSPSSESNLQIPLDLTDEELIEKEDDPLDGDQRTTGGQTKVFIYQSHNRESWIPELEGVTEPSEAYDPKINVSLLGSRLTERLKTEGIGAASTDVDYASTVKGYNWNFSYKYSLQTVKEASAVYPELEYYIDIHRDSQKREYTTTTINGKDYGQIYFVVGHKNPNWKKNEKFAAEIHDRLEEKYPTISRGVWGKTANTGHAEYNQSVSPNSILVEIGGTENTLEESYRTVDALGEVLAEYFWENQAIKVDADVEQ